MSKNPNLPSRLLTCAGALMILSGILMAVCFHPAYGGILWAAAFCMFFAAYHFRKNQTEESEEKNNEKKTL